jgi:2,3-bisphosphoglycerate-dependent phosphoglycerate mutase
MTFYLVRHAQSLPTKSQFFSEWPLSPSGLRQAELLADLLASLGITKVFSSPFVRSVLTAKPFAERYGLSVTLIDDLRERLITNIGPPSDEVWCRGWEDFHFCPPGCETSHAAQSRMCRALDEIADRTRGDEVTAIFTHGNVMGLFLNTLASGFGREATEALTNPDVLKINKRNGSYIWDQEFRLPGLESFATTHRQTPREEDGNDLKVHNACMDPSTQ